MGKVIAKVHISSTLFFEMEVGGLGLEGINYILHIPLLCPKVLLIAGL